MSPSRSHTDTRADVELLREAAECWPTPNPYTAACDQLQMSFDSLLADLQRLEEALREIIDTHATWSSASRIASHALYPSAALRKEKPQP